MRTYIRKKTECQLIEGGVEDLCRLCLGKSTSSVQIFTDDCENDICGPLRLRIMICVGLEMTREDCLPNNICVECYKELEKYYTFRKKCEITYQKLKSHVMAVKEIERRKNLGIMQKMKIETDDKFITQEETIQHMVLSLNGEHSAEPVNVFNSIQLNNLQESNSCTNDTMKYVNLESHQNDDIQMQNVSVTNLPTFGTEESQSPMPMILSSILLELGVLQQQPDGTLLMVDPDLKIVELEGENNAKVTLELVEEDTILDGTESNNTQEQIFAKVTAVTANYSQNSSETNVVQDHLNKLKSKNSSDKEKDDRWCSTCGKRFASPNALTRHQRVHSGEKPYSCRVCGRKFGQREVMTRHELVHRTKRPFACSRCPKSFTQRGALAQHARQHARTLALHRCGFCSKVFLYASGLSRHMTVHTGKVFVCNACGRHFRDKSSLLRHLRNSHPDTESTPSALPTKKNPQIIAPQTIEMNP